MLLDPILWLLAFTLLVSNLKSLHVLGDASTCTCPVVKTIKFGQSAPLSGANALSGSPVRDGILAAFNEFNQDTREDKKPIRLVLDSKDDMYVVANSVLNMQLFVEDPELFGIMGIVGTSAIETTAPLAIQHNFPVLGTYGGMGLRQPFQRNVISVRGSYFDESAGIVEFFASRSKKRIALFAQNDAFGLSARSGMMAALDSTNLQLHSEAYYTKGNASAWPAEIQAALKIMSKSVTSSSPPEAVVIAAVYDPAAMFIRQLQTKWPNTDVVCLSSVSIVGVVELLAPTPNDTRLLENLYTSQFFLNPGTSNDRLIQSFRAAADKIGVSNSHYLALEGYVMARLAIAAFQRIKGTNITQNAFLDVLYNDSFFNMDGFRYGPFYPTSVRGGCNQGIQGTRIAKVNQNKSLSDVFSMSFSTCGYRRKVWKKLVFGQSCTLASGCDAFRDGLLAAFKQINDAGGVRGTTRLMLQTKDDLGDPKVALINNYEFIDDPEIFGLIGSSALAIDEMIELVENSDKLLFGAFTGDNDLREPFHRQIVNFRASTDDEIFAMVHHCYYNRKVSKFSVLYEDTRYGNERRNQLEVAVREKRWSIVSEVSYASEDQIDEAVKKLFSDATTQIQVVVFIGLGDVTARILPEIHGRDRSILVYGLSETRISRELIENEAIAPKVNLDNFVITSVVPHPGGTDSELNKAYADALRNLNPQASISVAGLEGFVVGQLLTISLTRIMAQDLTVDNLLDSIYENGYFDVYGLKCGPLQDNATNSTTSKRKLCNQCMKKIFLIKASGDMVEDFEFDGTCMYETVENVDFGEGTLRIPFVVLAILGILLTVALLVLHFVFRKNAHVSIMPTAAKIVVGIGAILCFSEVLVIFPVPTDTTCPLTPWVIDLSFVLLMGPLLGRIMLIDKIIDEKKHEKKIKHHRKHSKKGIVAMIVTLLVLCLLFLVVYTAVDPPHMEEAFTSNGLRYERCATNSNTFLILNYVVVGVILLWCVLICQRLARSATRVPEVKRLSMCIYHTTLLAACYALLKWLTTNSPNIQFVCVAITLVESTLFLVIVVLFRPVYKAMRNDPLDQYVDSNASAPTQTPPTLRSNSYQLHPVNRNSFKNAPGNSAVSAGSSKVPGERKS